MAQLVVTAVLVEGRSKSEVAREYGVSRRWVITLVQRFLTGGDAGLQPRSRRPHHSPGRTVQAVEDEIIALRKDLDRHGHEAGAATIAAHLEQRHGPDGVPAVSTIWRILSARGFVTPQPHKRPKSSYERFCADAPNERWQLDITHYRLADGSEVEVLNMIDDHSRLAIASTTRRIFTAADVDTAFGKPQLNTRRTSVVLRRSTPCSGPRLDRGRVAGAHRQKTRWSPSTVRRPRRGTSDVLGWVPPTGRREAALGRGRRSSGVRRPRALHEE
jgi:transposase